MKFRVTHTRSLEGPWVLNGPKAPGEFVIIGYKCLRFDFNAYHPRGGLVFRSIIDDIKLIHVYSNFIRNA